MDRVDEIGEAMANITKQLEASRKQLDALKSKSDVNNEKIAAKRKQIEDSIADITRADGVSYEDIKTTMELADRIYSELCQLFEVQHYLFMLKDYFDGKIAASNQLMVSRNARMDEMKQKMLACEELFDPSKDENLIELQNVEKVIEEKREKLREAQNENFNYKLSIEQKKTQIKEIEERLENIKAENHFLKSNKGKVKEMDQAFAAAIEHQKELDTLLGPVDMILKDCEKSYAIQLKMVYDYESSKQKLVDIKNTIALAKKEEAELDELTQNCSEQIAALNLGLETRANMYEKKKKEMLEYINDLRETITATDQRIAQAILEIEKNQTEGEQAEIQAKFIQSEYEFWKRSVRDRFDDNESDEEAEVDADIADAETRLEDLKKRAAKLQKTVKLEARISPNQADQPEIHNTEPVQSAVVQEQSQIEVDNKKSVDIDDEPTTCSQLKADKTTNEVKVENLTQNIPSYSQPSSQATIFMQNEDSFDMLCKNEETKFSQPVSDNVEKDVEMILTQSLYFDPSVIDTTPVKTQDKRRNSDDEISPQKFIKKDESHLSPKQEYPATEPLTIDILDTPVKSANIPSLSLTPIAGFSKASSSSIVDAYNSRMGVKEKEEEKKKEKEKEKFQVPTRRSLFKPSQSIDQDFLDDPIKGLTEDLKEDKNPQPKVKTRRSTQKQTENRKSNKLSKNAH